MIALFQTVADAKEILTIESVSVIGLLLFMIYLIWQNHLLKKDGKEKDSQIAAIIAEHRADLKDGNKDIITLVAKYHTFVEQLSSIRNAHHR